MSQSEQCPKDSEKFWILVFSSEEWMKMDGRLSALHHSLNVSRNPRDWKFAISALDSRVVRALVLYWDFHIGTHASPRPARASSSSQNAPGSSSSFVGSKEARISSRNNSVGINDSGFFDMLFDFPVDDSAGVAFDTTPTPPPHLRQSYIAPALDPEQNLLVTWEFQGSRFLEFLQGSNYGYIKSRYLQRTNQFCGTLLLGCHE